MLFNSVTIASGAAIASGVTIVSADSKNRVLRRIPKSARQQCSNKLTAVLRDVVSSNSVEAWNKLYLFAPRCLRLPKNSKTTDSLASHVKRQLQDDLATSPTSTSTIKQNKKAKKSFNPGLYLARQVSMKIEEGDFRGAIRLAGSDNTLVVFSDETYDALCSKHPPPHPNSQIPPNPTMSTLYAFGVSCADVIQAVRSFSCGSAGGADRLRPQHLKDLLQQVGDEDLDECPLLTVLADFCSLVLRGDVPRAVRPFFFGASLVALRKKTGGVRPIAVGCTLRRLVAKIAGRKVLDEMTNLLAPHQLGYGVRGGAEAAVHAARRFLHGMDQKQAIVKLNFANAFNSVRRDCVPSAVQILCPIFTCSSIRHMQHHPTWFGVIGR